MAPSDHATASPLLPPAAPKTAAAVNKFVAALAGLKLAFGLGCLLAPRLAFAALLLDPPAAQAVVVTQLYGGAVAALGGLLWMVAAPRYGSGRSQRLLLKDTLAVHVAADAVDVVSCGVGLATGALRMPVFGVVGGGCAVLAALGAAAYRSVVVLED
ncbi:hypothetical protein ISF_03815 [Cordyceps fumosorosea ARSEF 2679]|uniref:MARVEL-like domain protein n=1 Tax=Cordyceps fumosorosea (strain ARSEF 2679) TaxID=1081104 RepID=A0A167ZL00_CORFA|nr:hypothetical protein ISF_03815 [Cordyceps fumosorosea ARSEF 2679]OAA67639.1 hypothetical protein ISF_03815 [Cordyceps fumosorosea ARSEF 2679]